MGKLTFLRIANAFLHLYLVLACNCMLTSLYNAPPFAAASQKITDILYNDKRFSKLVKALQHTHLIPRLNKLRTATFFAPTNEAFKDLSTDITQDHILYHLLNREIQAHEFYDDQLLETALVNEDSLGKNGQRIKVNRENKNHIYLNDVQIIDKNLQADNGIVHVINELLIPPKNIFNVTSKISNLSTFVQAVKLAQLDKALDNDPRLTVFAPTDSAIEKGINYIQREYLSSESAREDLLSVVKNHIHDGLIYSDIVSSDTMNVPTRHGENLTVEICTDGKVCVNDSSVVTKDILAGNGVVHTVEGLFLPKSLTWNTRKYLIGLNGGKFVSALEKNGLESYLSNTKTSYTFLVPHDELIDDWTPDFQSKDLKKLLKYHIVEGKWRVDDLRNSSLIKTELSGKELKGHKQRASVSVEDQDGKVNIQFNDASVIRGPVEIDNSIIYVISQVLQPPADVIQSTVEDIRLSTFTTAIFSTGLDEDLRTASGVTFFAPTNDAFSRLGLVTNYLLLPGSRENLSSVVKYHVVDRVLYTDELPAGESSYPTLTGSKIVINRRGEDISLHDNRVNGTNATSNVVDRDIPIKTGVFHVIDNVQIPPTLNITLQNLLTGMHANTLFDVLRLTNLTDILADANSSYTVLAPSDRAFSRINLDSWLADRNALLHLAKLHIIPSGIKELHDGDEYPTLLHDGEVTVIVRKVADDDFSIVLKRGFQHGGGDEQATVEAFGRTTGGGSVIEIDQVLLPRQPPTSRVFIGFITAALAGILIVGGVMTYEYVKNRNARAGYEPIAGEQ